MKKLSCIFPHKSTSLISDTLFDTLESLDQNLKNKNSLIRIEFLQNVDRDIRYSMEGKARNIMHNLEIQEANKLILVDNEWLVVDGALRKANFLKLENTIGLAKSFSRKPVFDLGNGNPLMITTYLSKIRRGERSAVFKQKLSKTEDIAFWYLRLRTYPPMEPLGGIVKIEFHLKEDKLSKELLQLIDEISAEVYAYRSPSIYPYPRWPSFIYPIRLTEMLMKSVKINKEMIAYYGKELNRVIKGGR